MSSDDDILQNAVEQTSRIRKGQRHLLSFMGLRGIEWVILGLKA